MAGRRDRASARSVLGQAWWAPVAVAVALCDLAFAAWVLTDEQGTLPGRVVGPVLMALAGVGLVVGLVRRADPTPAGGRRAPSVLLAIGALAGLAALVVGGPALVVAGAALLLAAGLALLRGAHGAGADALVVAGTLPCLLLFWFVVPTVLAVVVLVGLVTSPRRQVALA